MQRLTDVRFAAWKAKVNEICLKELGLITDDLQDYNWRELFDASEEPEEAFWAFYEDVIVSEVEPCE